MSAADSTAVALPPPGSDSASDTDSVEEMPGPAAATGASAGAGAAADAPAKKDSCFTLDDGTVIDYDAPIPVDQLSAEADPADGYRPITWRQLRYTFCYERPAHGFKLAGDISQKHQQHWDRSKQIKLRDSEGGEGAIFFYDDSDPSTFAWEDVAVGSYMEVKSPRLHKFMDGQEGMRVESHGDVLRVVKQHVSDARRFEYGSLHKANGNAKVAKAMAALEREEAEARAKGQAPQSIAQQRGPHGMGGSHMPNSAARLFEDAIGSYETAIGHLECTFHESTPERRREAREALASCFLNVAACQIAQQDWAAVELPCEKALRLNVSAQLNAKAYFRWGRALLELGHTNLAHEKLARADQLAPNDAKIGELLHRIATMRYEEQQADRELFLLRQRRRAEAAAASAGAWAAAAAKGGPAGAESAAAGQAGEPAAVTGAAAATATSAAPGAAPVVNGQFGVKRSLFGPPPVGLCGIRNFRDLGGLPCSDGRTVTRKFLLYRSSNLFDATTGGESNDLRTLVESFGVKTILDMRNEHETRMLARDAQRRHASAAAELPAAKRAPFVDYRDRFTALKIICSARKTPAAAARAAPAAGAQAQAQAESGAESPVASPTGTSSPMLDFPTGAEPASPLAQSSPMEAAREAVAAAAGSPAAPPRLPRHPKEGASWHRRILTFFMWVSGGDTRPSPFLDSRAVKQQRTWITILSREKAADGSGAVARRYPSDLDEVTDVLANRRVIVRIDLLTRGLVAVSSYWILAVVAVLATCLQFHAASVVMTKLVINTLGQQRLFESVIEFQGPEIATIFQLAAEERNYPLVVTCMMGKDRTGLITALLLAAADVRFDAICRDYSTATNDALKGAPHLLAYQRGLGMSAEWEAADAKVLKAVFVFMQRKYGGLHQYLHGIGITAAQIQEIRRILTRPLE